jgi:hypothetical protein
MKEIWLLGIFVTLLLISMKIGTIAERMPVEKSSLYDFEEDMLHPEDVADMMIANQYLQFEWDKGTEYARLVYSGPSKAEPTRDTIFVLAHFNSVDDGAITDVFYLVD